MPNADLLEHPPEREIEPPAAVLVNASADENRSHRGFENSTAGKALSIVGIAEPLEHASTLVPRPDVGFAAEKCGDQLRIVQKAAARVKIVAAAQFLKAVAADPERPAEGELLQCGRRARESGPGTAESDQDIPFTPGTKSGNARLALGDRFGRPGAVDEIIQRSSREHTSGRDLGPVQAVVGPSDTDSAEPAGNVRQQRVAYASREALVAESVPDPKLTARTERVSRVKGELCLLAHIFGNAVLVGEEIYPPPLVGAARCYEKPRSPDRIIVFTSQKAVRAEPKVVPPFGTAFPDIEQRQPGQKVEVHVVRLDAVHVQPELEPGRSRRFAADAVG